MRPSHATPDKTPPVGRRTPAAEGERGSALVIAILVTVILALLGIAFLLMG